MKQIKLSLKIWMIFILPAIIFMLTATSCKKNKNNMQQQPQEMGCQDKVFGCDTYDIDAKGIPTFVNANYIELNKIGAITRFRSGVGHDYSDDFESCRSMKHYFTTGLDRYNDTSIRIFSPVNGTIITMEDEWTGKHIKIKCKEYPAFFFDIFHVNLKIPLAVGNTVTENQFLGNHSSPMTMSDIAVMVVTPKDGPVPDKPKGWKNISWFDVISEPLFQQYKARGIPNRDTVKISKTVRDADFISCQTTWSTNPGLGKTPNWIVLK